MNPENLPSTMPVSAPPRERLLMDGNWRFALGHASDVNRDFNHASGEFSHFAKAGFGSGASAPEFDDQEWRQIDLPHDWAVELPFSERGSKSHGYKAIGRNFPESSVGWYRRRFAIPASDLGKRISVEFDGVFRDCRVWINGHYLGGETSGYSSFSRNLTEFLNYDGENVLTVRVDASLEEGWFYEGAGIYRHVWLVKTMPLHVQRHGVFVTAKLTGQSADVIARARISNEGGDDATFEMEQTILDGEAKIAGVAWKQQLNVSAGGEGEFSQTLTVVGPTLWSLDSPSLYKLITTVRQGAEIVDRYETTFGIRTIHFDADKGFFLNGQHVKIKGTNNHQDHAGVGVAIPDALQEFRIRKLQEFGCNTYRVSHNPPTPELLDACDRLGMLVIDENRLTGTDEYHYDHLKRLILRDRNHPSIILWSIGNEEWKIEGNEIGEQICSVMQNWVKRLDPARPVTVAISGGWGGGFSGVIEVAGLNYLCNMAKCGFTTDQWQARRPEQPVVGTEECAFTTTRGTYLDDLENCHLRAYDWKPSDWGSSVEYAWSHYAERPSLAGMCIWTGFDYRGEPMPFNWPAVTSQFGILDLCGFPKDAMFYLKAWWTDEPVMHLFPHWNWPGREGEEISVWAYSNCDEVELFLNGLSLGRKAMARNSHLEWSVKYSPGTLLARGFKEGTEILVREIETTGEPVAVKLAPDRTTLGADGADATVIAVHVADAQERLVPTAGHVISFELTGPGKIIGIGNGDPSSHEPEKFVATKGAPSPVWSRRLFNGLAQIIVQSTGTAGEIRLTASSRGCRAAAVELRSISCARCPEVS